MRLILTAYLFFCGMGANAQVCYLKACKPGSTPQDSIVKQDLFFKPKQLDTVIVSSTYCPKRISCGNLCRMVKARKDTLVKPSPAVKETIAIISTEFKIYPNPVPPGKPLIVFMQAEQTGPHIVVVNNAAGLLVFQTMVQLSPGRQRISLPIGNAWSRGMYFVRVMNIKKMQIAAGSFMAG